MLSNIITSSQEEFDMRLTKQTQLFTSDNTNQ